MSFVHLHVASGFSLRHGADTPAALTAADFLGGKVCVLRKGKRNYATVRAQA